MAPVMKKSINGVKSSHSNSNSTLGRVHGRTLRTVHVHASSGPDSVPAAVNTRRAVLQSSVTTLTAAAASSLLTPVAPAIAGIFGDDSNANSIGNSWEKVNLGLESGVVLQDISFVPDQPERGFLLGSRQTLLETNDGGKTWKSRDVSKSSGDDINYRFNSISFAGKEGWIVGKPAIMLHTSDGGDNWERVPLSAKLPGTPVLVKALPGAGQAEMTTDQGAIYVTSNTGYTWKAAVEETIDATLNRTVSSGISGASYYTGTLSTIARSDDGKYVAVSSRGNFFMTWEPGQTFWQPHNRNSARRPQNMGWRRDGGLWMLTRGGGMFFAKGTGVQEDFDEETVGSRGFGILDIGYQNEKKMWAVGGSGTLLVSTDGGNSWKRERQADDLAGNLYAVRFDTPDKGFILGNDGILLRYIGKA